MTEDSTESSQNWSDTTENLDEGVGKDDDESMKTEERESKLKEVLKESKELEDTGRSDHFHFEDEGEEEEREAKSIGVEFELPEEDAASAAKIESIHKKRENEILSIILKHLPSEAGVRRLTLGATKSLKELEKLPESLIPEGLTTTISELIDCVLSHRKAHSMCTQHTSDQTSFMLSMEKTMEDMKEKLQESDENLEAKQNEITNLERKLDSYHLREQELQEELEIHAAEIKHLHEEMQRRDDIQADIDEEIGTSGRAREAYAKQKKKLKEQMDAVEVTLDEMKDERNKVIDMHKSAVFEIEELRKEIVAKNDLLLHREEIMLKIDHERNDMRKAIYGTKNIFKLVHSSFKNFESHIMKLERANFAQAAQIDGLLKRSTDIFKTNLYYFEESAKYKKQIEELLHAYNNVFTYLQGQEMKLKQQMRKVRDLESKLSFLTRKHSKAVMQSKDACEEKSKMAKDYKVYERSLRDKDREIENFNKQLSHMVKEIERYQIVIYKLEEQKKEAVKKVDNSFIILSSEKSTQQVQSGEIFALKREVEKNESKRKRLIFDNTALMQKIEEDCQEIRLSKKDMYNTQKVLVVTERQHKHLITEYNKLMNEKNTLYGKFVECKIQLSNEEGKVKLANWQVDHLKDELNDKDLMFRNKDIESRKSNFYTRRLEIHLKKLQNKYSEIKFTTSGKNPQLIDSQKQLNKALIRIINQDKNLAKSYTEVANLKTQLDRRVAEITILNEKLEVISSLLSRGGVHYNQRLEDVRLLKIEVQKLRREKGILIKGYQNNADLRSELYFLYKDLSEERQRSQALQEQLENPLNYHRWRMLEGTDPEKKELIDKILLLQKKLNKANEDISFRKYKYERISKLYQALKKKYEMLPPHEELANYAELKLIYRKKCEECKTLESQLMVFEREIRDYKIEMNLIQKDLTETKKKFYEIKLKDDRRKLKLNGNNLPKLQTTKLGTNTVQMTI